MTLPVLIDATRIAAAAYALAVALGAVLGFHRPLLTFPFRALYSLVRVVLLTVSRGKIALAVPARQVGRKGSRSFGNIRGRLRERRDELAEGRGEVIESPAIAWTAGTATAPTQASPVAPPSYQANEGVVAAAAAYGVPPVEVSDAATATSLAEPAPAVSSPLAPTPWDEDDEDEYVRPSFR